MWQWSPPTAHTQTDTHTYTHTQTHTHRHTRTDTHTVPATSKSLIMLGQVLSAAKCKGVLPTPSLASTSACRAHAPAALVDTNALLDVAALCRRQWTLTFTPPPPTPTHPHIRDARASSSGSRWEHTSESNKSANSRRRQGGRELSCSDHQWPKRAEPSC